MEDILAPKPEPLPEDDPGPSKLVAPSAHPYRFTLRPLDYQVYLLSYMMAGIYGAYVLFTQAKFATVLYTFVMTVLSVLGVTAGAHRLWSHHAYKVKPQLEVFMVFIFLMSNQTSIATWVRTHRLHHLGADTDADPHNASRGFFFSHFGWMMVKHHVEVQRREPLIDVSDMMSNPIVRFQEKYIVPLHILAAHIIPCYIPTLWGESYYVAIMANLFRGNVTLHIANCINSVAHLVGYKPIDKTAVGTQFPLVGIISTGEGFHNYHHTFPFDYRSSEVGDTKYNLAAMFIELMAKIGWAYDLKVASEGVVRKRVLRKGDGSDIYYLPEEARTKQQKFCCFEVYKYDKTK